MTGLLGAFTQSESNFAEKLLIMFVMSQSLLLGVNVVLQPNFRCNILICPQFPVHIREVHKWVYVPYVCVPGLRSTPFCII